MPSNLPSPEYLHKLLRYEPRTGKLYWRDRTPDMIPYCTSRSKEKMCASWNARWSGSRAFASKDADGYHNGSINGKTYKASHVIWAMINGIWPSETGSSVMYKDRNRSNNRVTNLRLVARKRSRVPEKG